MQARAKQACHFACSALRSRDDTFRHENIYRLGAVASDPQTIDIFFVSPLNVMKKKPLRGD